MLTIHKALGKEAQISWRHLSPTSGSQNCLQCAAESEFSIDVMGMCFISGVSTGLMLMLLRVSLGCRKMVLEN